MKISFVFQLLPLLILFVVTPALAADSALEPVRDQNGDILRSGVGYYILPFLLGRVGGVTLRATRNNTCPLDVVQSSIQTSNGTPFTFTPVDPKKGVIRVSTDLNIEFTGATTCIQSMVWRIADFDELTRQTFITTRGEKGNPGRETIGNWFKIVKLEVGMYKFVYCPTVCDVCRPRCGDIGIFMEDGVRRLALTRGEPMRIRFKKAETGSV